VTASLHTRPAFIGPCDAPCRIVRVRLVRLSGLLRTVRRMDTITAAHGPTRTDPRDIYLKAEEVHRRYTWGRTLGYEMLRSTGFPRALGGRYRLDTLLAWDERVLTGELTGRPDPRPRAAKRAPGAQPQAATATTTDGLAPSHPTAATAPTVPTTSTTVERAHSHAGAVDDPTRRRRTRGVRRAA
jgi:hypothetical protein